MSKCKLSNQSPEPELTHHNQVLTQRMVHPMDDIARQARQGSVAAIIQVLNEKLADSGVRTRAVLAEGVLQILCEAATVDQLDQSPLVERIRQILEAIAPRNIRRVNINSRIVREQQLLWLEEINRDPNNQLLWSQQIILRKPNIIKRLIEDITTDQDPLRQQAFLSTPSPRQIREQRQLMRGVMWGTGISVLVFIGAWIFYKSMNIQQAQNPETTPANPSEVATPQATPSPAEQSTEPFAEAVRLAEQASAEGKVAKTSSDWLVVAAKWQQAADLMASVTPDYPRYDVAQNRTALYRRNSQIAQEEAEKLRVQTEQ